MFINHLVWCLAIISVGSVNKYISSIIQGTFYFYLLIIHFSPPHPYFLVTLSLFSLEKLSQPSTHSH